MCSVLVYLIKIDQLFTNKDCRSYRRWPTDISQMWRKAHGKVIHCITAVRLQATNCAQQSDQCNLNGQRIFCHTFGPVSVDFVVRFLIVQTRIGWIVWIRFRCWGFCGCRHNCGRCRFVCRWGGRWCGSVAASSCCSFAMRMKEVNLKKNYICLTYLESKLLRKSDHFF